MSDLPDIYGEKGKIMKQDEYNKLKWAYDFGFSAGYYSIKRYAVNVISFDVDLVCKDGFKLFSTLEEAKGYIKGVAANNECMTYLYEYNNINEQYESLEA